MNRALGESRNMSGTLRTLCGRQQKLAKNMFVSGGMDWGGPVLCPRAVSRKEGEQPSHHFPLSNVGQAGLWPKTKQTNGCFFHLNLQA